MQPTLHLEFGADLKQAVGKAVRDYIRSNYSSASEAAQVLGITKQRLWTYTSGRALPRAHVLEAMRREWNLHLFSLGPHPGREPSLQDRSADQLALFDEPRTFMGDGVQVTIERKGPSKLEVKVVTIASIALQR